jgi:cytochrome c peroxidase
MSSKKIFLKLIITCLLLIFVVVITVCKRAAVQTIAIEKESNKQSQISTDEPILPLPTELELDTGKVALGERLFNDARLSEDNTISCASCHNLKLGGTDNLVFSVGIKGQVGEINAPTVFNSTYNFKQFWDGRAETLEDQIDGPTHSSKEMGSNWEVIVDKIKGSTDYSAEFASLYQDGVNAQNIKDAIATFERSLITPNSRFDQYLKGYEEILTLDEKQGYQLFKSVGCISCHQGINVGGNLFEEFGVMGKYFKDRGNITEADLGRYNVTKQEYDRYVFKVPTLRNIEHSSPYFHDGSVKKLEDAVEVMSKYQLGRKLSQSEISYIVKFLKTLNGDYVRYIK